jgi:hypothetical protein
MNLDVCHVCTNYIKCCGVRLYVGKILSSGNGVPGWGEVADCRCSGNIRLTLLTEAVLELLDKLG